MVRHAFLADGFARANMVAPLFPRAQMLTASQAVIVICMKITGRPPMLRAAPSVAHDR